MLVRGMGVATVDADISVWEERGDVPWPLNPGRRIEGATDALDVLSLGFEYKGTAGCTCMPIKQFFSFLSFEEL